jgi:hypothetical protein
MDEVRTARSYLSPCDARVHFGLGGAARIESVQVTWPSGKVTRVRDVPVNQVLSVSEEGKGDDAASR